MAGSGEFCHFSIVLPSGLTYLSPVDSEQPEISLLCVAINQTFC
ncbi:hypothetical protein SAMN04488128_103985 [Chitinophaga eiseniae]|uniref:Uncharacterized protein n=1 Tax=Chitinophaga eiseniae TaxID=634771 RepID=A0A1T4T2E5_9BACT|nr:hypothetical protein SAMN04488128_103985 [Chitinophaga eiseniae]